MSPIQNAVQFVRRYWLIILALLINVAIAGPLAADWESDVCWVNGHYVACCTECTFFCTCGDSPAP